MRKKNLGSVYDRLMPEERFHLVLEAAARRDETEVERLANTSPRYRYTSVRNDPAFSNRIRASRQLSFCVCLMLMEISAKLKLIKTSREYISLLSRSLITEFDRGFLRGWEAGCDHAWQSAGMAGPFPWRDNSDPGQEADEVAGAFTVENADGDDDELEEASEALATEVQSLWEAFSRVCRVEMGSEPETVLLTWFPSVVDWIEGALNAADNICVDADIYEEYVRALTTAWREYLREA